MNKNLVAAELMKVAEDLASLDSIYEQLLGAGVEIDHHESDLYAKKTPDSERILRSYQYKSNVQIFKNNIDGTLWYDIPFAYTPWWDKAVSNLSGGRIKKIAGEREAKRLKDAYAKLLQLSDAIKGQAWAYLHDISEDIHKQWQLNDPNYLDRYGIHNVADVENMVDELVSVLNGLGKQPKTAKELVADGVVWDENYANVGKVWDSADYTKREKMLQDSIPRLDRNDARSMVLLKFVWLPYEVRRRLKLRSMGIAASIGSFYVLFHDNSGKGEKVAAEFRSDLDAERFVEQWENAGGFKRFHADMYGSDKNAFIDWSKIGGDKISRLQGRTLFNYLMERFEE